METCTQETVNLYSNIINNISNIGIISTLSLDGYIGTQGWVK